MENQEKEIIAKGSIFRGIAETRARSYLVYLVFFLLGVCFNAIYHYNIFDNNISIPMGYICLIIASLVILWSQKTLRNFKKENMSKENFYRGPFRLSRAPTQFGLFLLLFGLGLIVNSFFITLFSVVAFIVGRYIFINIEEKILIKKYGAPYLEYKKSVMF